MCVTNGQKRVRSLAVWTASVKAFVEMTKRQSSWDGGKEVHFEPAKFLRLEVHPCLRSMRSSDGPLNSYQAVICEDPPHKIRRDYITYIVDDTMVGWFGEVYSGIANDPLYSVYSNHCFWEVVAGFSATVGIILRFSTSGIIVHIEGIEPAVII